MSLTAERANTIAPASGSPSRLSFGVGGMTCASCVLHVEKALKQVPGVSAVTINLARQRAEVTFAGAADARAAAAAVTEAGYDPVIDSVELSVGGMTCASCVAHVEKALRQVPGVLQADVNLATERATVRLLPGAASGQDLARAIEAAGYEVRRHARGADQVDRERQERQREEGALWRALLWSVALTLPVFGLEMGGHIVPGLGDWIVRLFGHAVPLYVSFVLATLVLAGPGRRFFVKGVAALLRGHPDMNALVAVGTGAAYL